MKTKPDKITPLVRKLKRLNDRYVKLCEAADAFLSESPWNPSPERTKLRKETDAVCARTMCLERQIITALLAQLP